jgi:hypothetical protein
MPRLCIKGDHRDKGTLFAFGDMYQLCSVGHQMDWNLADLVVPL